MISPIYRWLGLLLLVLGLLLLHTDRIKVMHDPDCSDEGVAVACSKLVNRAPRK